MTQLDTTPTLTVAAAGASAQQPPRRSVLLVAVLLSLVVLAAAIGPTWLLARSGVARRSSVAAGLAVAAVTALGIVATYAALESRRRALAQQSQLNALAAELDARSRAVADLDLRIVDLRSQLSERAESAVRIANRSERLQHFSAQMLDRVSVGSAVHLVVEEGRRALEASSAAVLVARDHDEPDITASHTPPDGVLLPARGRTVRTPLLDALRDGKPVWLENERALRDRYPGLGAGSPYRAWAALPLQLDGRRIGALALAYDDPARFSESERSYMMQVAQQCAQALERARLHDMELRARIRAEFAERRLALLAEASARLSASLDYLATLSNLSHIAVPEIADWCVVHLVDDDGVPRVVGAAHSDPAQAARRRSLEERFPASVHDHAAWAEVLRGGGVVHIEPVTEDYLVRVARNDEHLDALRSFGIKAQLSVPLLVDDRVRGVVTFANAESGRRFSESDITLATELGRRAGNAVENARLYLAANHASEAKSDFLAVVSHELRTPLNAIMGYSDLLLMGVPDTIPGRAVRQIERIRSASTSLLQLVDEVLSFSRIEAGKEDIRISPVDISALLRECTGMIEPLAVEKGLAVEIEMPDEPIKVISDERKIRQILTNLLSNAVKFTESGNVDLRAFAKGPEVVIEVRDTGIGIAPDNLERIFDPFWQVEQTATRRFGGTGLGLGVARKLAKLLEGRIEVCSTVGAGSVFRLVLPLHTPGIQRAG